MAYLTTKQPTQPKGFVENAVDTAKRLYLGADTMFMPNKPVYPNGNAPAGVDAVSPEHPGYPAIFDQVPSGIYRIAQVAQQMVGAKPANNAYLERAAARSEDVDQNERKYLNITTPQNAWQQGAEIAGSMLVPIGGEAKAASNLSKVGKVGNAIKNTVVETALPLRQGKLLPTLATQVPIGVGVREGLHKLAGQQNDPDYHPIVPDKAKPVQTASNDIPADLFDTGGQQHTASDIPHDLFAVSSTAQQPPGHTDLFAGPAEPPLHPDPLWKNPVVLGAAALTIGGLAMAPGVIRMRTRNQLDSLGQVFGTERPAQFTSIPTKIIAGTVQADQPVRVGLKAAVKAGTITQEAADENIRKLDLLASSPISQKVQSFFGSGTAPNSAAATKPLKHTLDNIANNFDDKEWSALSDGLLAKSALDDIKRTGKQSSFTTNKDGTPITPADLQAIADVVENDAKLRPIADDIRKHYRDIYDYKLEQGLISQKEYNQSIQDRPNYVKFKKSEVLDNADTGTNGGMGRDYGSEAARSSDTGAGSQAGRTADPISQLSSEWQSAIRDAEINRTKSDILKHLSSSPATKDFVKVVPGDSITKGMDNVHKVFENGTPTHYHVTDQALDKALTFAPATVKNGLFSVLNGSRKAFQKGTTGYNPAFLPVSVAYSTLTSMINKPHDIQMGLVNEMFNRFGVGQSTQAQAIRSILSAADPTAWLSGPIGTIRLWADSTNQALADHLTQALSSNDLIAQTLGTQRTQALRDMFADAFHKSIKFRAEDSGALNANAFDTANPNKVGAGVKAVSPKFAARAQERSLDERIAQSQNDVNKIILGMKQAGGTLANESGLASLGRAYSWLVNTIHEGPAYSIFAANEGKAKTAVDMERIASQTRRVQGDVGQKGGSQAMATANDIVPYLNPTMQALAEFGRGVKNRPAMTALNVTAAMGAATALQYGSLMLDEKTRERYAQMSPDQKARSIVTPFGNIQIDPLHRLWWAPLNIMMGEISGANSGKFDPNFSNSMERWLEHGMSEEGALQLQQGEGSAVASAGPVDPTSWSGLFGSTVGQVPAVNALGAAAGYDFGMGRFADTARTIQGQQLSPAGGQGTYVDDAINANYEKSLGALFGTLGDALMRASLDAHRALGDNTPHSHSALDVAMSRLVDSQVKGQIAPTGLMFQGHERVQSAAQPDMALWQAKKTGLQSAIQTLNQDIYNKYATGKDPRYAQPLPLDFIRPEYEHTALAPIGLTAVQLEKATKPLLTEMAALQKQAQAIQSQKHSTIGERNSQLNENIAQRKQYSAQLNAMTRMAEDAVRQQIGDPSFSFQGFDVNKYKSVPFPPQVQGQQ